MARRFGKLLNFNNVVLNLKNVHSSRTETDSFEVEVPLMGIELGIELDRKRRLYLGGDFRDPVRRRGPCKGPLSG